MTDAYVFVFVRPDGVYGAVNDKDGRLVVSANAMLAYSFAVALERRLCRTITAIRRNPVEVAELVLSAHVAATDITAHIAFIETGDCTDAEDALWRAIGLANEVPADSVGDWAATHSAIRTTAGDR